MLGRLNMSLSITKPNDLYTTFSSSANQVLVVWTESDGICACLVRKSFFCHWCVPILLTLECLIGVWTEIIQIKVEKLFNAELMDLED